MSTSVMLPSTPSLSTGGRSTGGRKPASTAVAVASNNNFPDISKLQNLCKRDPVGHREDYDAQVRRLRSECAVLSLSPSSNPPPKLPSLVQFVAAVSSGCYRGAECDRISSLLMSLLMGRPEDVANTATVSTFGSETDTDLSPAPTSALTLHRDVRRACVSALILMRNKVGYSLLLPPYTLFFNLLHFFYFYFRSFLTLSLLIITFFSFVIPPASHMSFQNPPIRVPFPLFASWDRSSD